MSVFIRLYVVNYGEDAKVWEETQCFVDNGQGSRIPA
jgi:hypothetical protein